MVGVMFREEEKTSRVLTGLSSTGCCGISFPSPSSCLGFSFVSKDPVESFRKHLANILDLKGVCAYPQFRSFFVTTYLGQVPSGTPQTSHGFVFLLNQGLF